MGSEGCSTVVVVEGGILVSLGLEEGLLKVCMGMMEYGEISVADCLIVSSCCSLSVCCGSSMGG